MNGYLMLILSQVMLGSIAVFARWAHLPADVIVLFRCFFGASAIGAALLASRSIKFKLRLDKTLLLLVATGLFMASNWYFFFQSVLNTTITNAILLYNLAPIFVLISAAVFLREIPTVRQIACVVTSILGVGLILGPGAAMGSLDKGALFALVAGALYSQVTVIGRQLKHVPALLVTQFQTGVGALLFLPISHSNLVAAHISYIQWSVLATIGVFHTAVPYLLYFKALQTVKATVAGIMQYIYTLSGIAFGVVLFHESLTGYAFVGGVVILASSFIALRHPGKKSIRSLWQRPAAAPVSAQA